MGNVYRVVLSKGITAKGGAGKTKEHQLNDARGVFRRAIVTCPNDVHRASRHGSRSVPSRAFSFPPTRQDFILVTEREREREPWIEPSKLQGGQAASPTPRRSPSWLLLTRKEEGN